MPTRLPAERYLRALIDLPLTFLVTVLHFFASLCLIVRRVPLSLFPFADTNLASPSHLPLSLPIAPNCVSRHANSLLVALLLLAYCNSIRTETPTTATTDARERFLPTTIYLLVYLLLLISSACTCNDAASISVFFRSMRKFEESIDRGGHAEGTIRLGRSLNDKARAKDKISRANWRQRAAESAREFAARHCRPTVR